MKQPWVQLVVVALLGIAIGRFLPVDRADAGPVAEESENEPGTRRSAKGPHRQGSLASASSFERMRREIRTAPPEQLPKLVYRSLQIVDPAERQAAVLEAFMRADSSNIRELFEQFAKITRETGRKNDLLRGQSIVTAGRIGGAEMLERWKAEGKSVENVEMASGLHGMALADPKAAMEWYNGPTNIDYPNKEKLLASIIGGATLKNTEEGIRMLEELPVKNRIDCLGTFSWTFIQNSGIDRAVDWMLDVRKSSAATEPAYAKAVEDEIYNKLFEAAEWTDGARELAGHLVRIHQDTPIAPNRMLATVSRMHGNSGLDLMDELARNPATATSEALEFAVTEAVDKSVKKSPAAVRKWLERHPESPLAPRIQQLMVVSSSE